MLNQASSPSRRVKKWLQTVEERSKDSARELGSDKNTEVLAGITLLSEMLKGYVRLTESVLVPRGEEGAVSSPVNQKIRKIIIDEIKRQGPIPFPRFQELCLYGPGGYFSSMRELPFQTDSYGEKPHMLKKLVSNIYEMWKELGCPADLIILEMGAGEGFLAKKILDILSKGKKQYRSLWESLRYCIVEISPTLIKRQRFVLKDYGGKIAQLEGSVFDLKNLFKQKGISNMMGVMISNELLDNFPAHIIVNEDGELKETYVTYNGKERVFEELRGDLSRPDEIEGYFDIVKGRPLPVNTEFALSLKMLEWQRVLSSVLDRGYIVTMDYGSEKRQRLFKDLGESVWTPRSIGAQMRILNPPCDLTSGVDFETLSSYGRQACGLETGVLMPASIYFNPSWMCSTTILIQSKNCRLSSASPVSDAVHLKASRANRRSYRIIIKGVCPDYADKLEGLLNYLFALLKKYNANAPPKIEAALPEELRIIITADSDFTKGHIIKYDGSGIFIIHPGFLELNRVERQSVALRLARIISYEYPASVKLNISDNNRLNSGPLVFYHSSLSLDNPKSRRFTEYAFAHLRDDIGKSYGALSVLVEKSWHLIGIFSTWQYPGKRNYAKMKDTLSEIGISIRSIPEEAKERWLNRQMCRIVNLRIFSNLILDQELIREYFETLTVFYKDEGSVIFTYDVFSEYSLKSGSGTLFNGRELIAKTLHLSRTKNHYYFSSSPALAAQAYFFEGNPSEGCGVSKAFKGRENFYPRQPPLGVEVSRYSFGKMFSGDRAFFEPNVKGVNVWIISDSHRISSLKIIDINSNDDNFIFFFSKYRFYLFSAIFFIIPYAIERKIFFTLQAFQLSFFPFRSLNGINDFLFAAAAIMRLFFGVLAQSNRFFSIHRNILPANFGDVNIFNFKAAASPAGCLYPISINGVSSPVNVCAICDICPITYRFKNIGKVRGRIEASDDGWIEVEIEEVFDNGRIENTSVYKLREIGSYQDAEGRKSAIWREDAAINSFKIYFLEGLNIAGVMNCYMASEGNIIRRDIFVEPCHRGKKLSGIMTDFLEYYAQALGGHFIESSGVDTVLEAKELLERGFVPKDNHYTIILGERRQGRKTLIYIVDAEIDFDLCPFYTTTFEYSPRPIKGKRYVIYTDYHLPSTEIYLAKITRDTFTMRNDNLTYNLLKTGKDATSLFSYWFKFSQIVISSSVSIPSAASPVFSSYQSSAFSRQPLEADGSTSLTINPEQSRKVDSRKLKAEKIAASPISGVNDSAENSKSRTVFISTGIIERQVFPSVQEKINAIRQNLPRSGIWAGYDRLRHVDIIVSPTHHALASADADKNEINVLLFLAQKSTEQEMAVVLAHEEARLYKPHQIQSTWDEQKRIMEVIRLLHGVKYVSVKKIHEFVSKYNECIADICAMMRLKIITGTADPAFSILEQYNSLYRAVHKKGYIILSLSLRKRLGIIERHPKVEERQDVLAHNVRVGNTIPPKNVVSINQMKKYGIKFVLDGYASRENIKRGQPLECINDSSSPMFDSSHLRSREGIVSSSPASPVSPAGALAVVAGIFIAPGIAYAFNLPGGFELTKILKPFVTVFLTYSWFAVIFSLINVILRKNIRLFAEKDSFERTLNWTMASHLIFNVIFSYVCVSPVYLVMSSLPQWMVGVVISLAATTALLTIWEYCTRPAMSIPETLLGDGLIIFLSTSKAMRFLYLGIIIVVGMLFTKNVQYALWWVVTMRAAGVFTNELILYRTQGKLNEYDGGGYGIALLAHSKEGVEKNRALLKMEERTRLAGGHFRPVGFSGGAGLSFLFGVKLVLFFEEPYMAKELFPWWDITPSFIGTLEGWKKATAKKPVTFRDRVGVLIDKEAACGATNADASSSILRYGKLRNESRKSISSAASSPAINSVKRLQNFVSSPILNNDIVRKGGEDITPPIKKVDYMLKTVPVFLKNPEVVVPRLVSVLENYGDRICDLGSLAFDKISLDKLCRSELEILLAGDYSVTNIQNILSRLSETLVLLPVISASRESRIRFFGFEIIRAKPLRYVKSGSIEFKMYLSEDEVRRISLVNARIAGRFASRSPYVSPFGFITFYLDNGRAIVSICQSYWSSIPKIGKRYHSAEKILYLILEKYLFSLPEADRPKEIWIAGSAYQLDMWCREENEMHPNTARRVYEDIPASLGYHEKRLGRKEEVRIEHAFKFCSVFMVKPLATSNENTRRYFNMLLKGRVTLDCDQANSRMAGLCGSPVLSANRFHLVGGKRPGVSVSPVVFRGHPIGCKQGTPCRVQAGYGGQENSLYGISASPLVYSVRHFRSSSPIGKEINGNGLENANSSVSINQSGWLARELGSPTNISGSLESREAIFRRQSDLNSFYGADGSDTTIHDFSWNGRKYIFTVKGEDIDREWNSILRVLNIMERIIDLTSLFRQKFSLIFIPPHFLSSIISRSGIYFLPFI